MSTALRKDAAEKHRAASAKKRAAREALDRLHCALRVVEKVLPAILAAYEATGDHDHGRGAIAPGAPCPGGDCLVDKARRILAALAKGTP